MTPISDRVAGPPLAGVVGTIMHHAAPAASVVSLPAVGARELRLDLFRGLALWLIFIDHVSPDLLTWLSHLVTLLTQQVGQARAQIIARFPGTILAYLLNLPGDCLRLLQKLLPGRPTIERLDFAQLIDGKIVGVDRGSGVDHGIEIWGIRVRYRWRHRIVITFYLRPALHHHRLDIQ